MTNNALDSQVGGDHYKHTTLQPFEITFANFGYVGVAASAYTKVNKYLIRDKGDHKENIEKAIHVLQIQLEFLAQSDPEVYAQTDLFTPTPKCGWKNKDSSVDPQESEEEWWAKVGKSVSTNYETSKPWSNDGGNPC